MKEEHFNLQEQLSEGLELKNWVLWKGFPKQWKWNFPFRGKGWFSEGHFPLLFLKNVFAPTCLKITFRQ